MEIINKIWAFRKKTGLHICFTLDAGANVHVLFPENEAKEIQEFIKKALVMHCQNEQFNHNNYLEITGVKIRFC